MSNSANNNGRDDREHATERPRFFLLAVFFFWFLALLALISFDSRDSMYLDGGIAGKPIIYNWLGVFGAYLSRFLLLIFGFAAFPLAFLAMTSSVLRALAGKRVRPFSWDYLASFLIAPLGLAMLCGIWPDFLPGLAAKLNMAGTAGGVLGQRLCAPDAGWLRLIFNPAGSAILGGALAAVGFGVIWWYDWHLACRDLLRSHLEDRRKAAATSQSPVDDSLVAAWEEKRRQNLTKDAETAESKPAPAESPRKPRTEAPEPASAAKPPAAKNTEPAEEAVPSRLGTAKPAGGRRQRGSQPKFILPGMELLDSGGAEVTVDPKEVENKKAILQATLNSFNIEAVVGEATSGPRVTLFEVLPAPGVKVERISTIGNNIAMELRAVSLRILTPIPGKNTVGIEVPNEQAATVSLSSLMQSTAWQKGKAEIPLLLGRNISGKAVVLDLAKAPHLLIAGATGSGKSVCMNAIIMSLLYRFSPEELRLIMVDPKVVEFRAYASLPHLVVPVISDVKKVPLALRWVIIEMQRRYQVLAKVGARNLTGFNSRPKEDPPVVDDEGNVIPPKLPYIVVIIDELADIMMTAKADVETSLARIAQLSRAVGIHAIIATQRPSVNVITGTIKANFPTRIAFQVTSQVDARTILDGKGAESLLGRGDMLFKPPGASQLERNQGAMVSDDEIDRVVKFVSDQCPQDFNQDVFKTVVSGAAADGDGAGAGTGSAGVVGGGEALSDEDEELVRQAIEIVLRDRRPTVSYLQRCLRVGYNKAALLIETLEERGIVGPQIGNAQREILVAADGTRKATAEEDTDSPDDDAGND